MNSEKKNYPKASEKVIGTAKFMGFVMGTLATCIVIGSFALGIGNYRLFKKLIPIPHEGEIVSTKHNGYLVNFKFQNNDYSEILSSGLYIFYSKGQKVKVYYNPDRPYKYSQKFYLISELLSVPVFIFLIGCLFLTLSYFLLIGKIKTRGF